MIQYVLGFGFSAAMTHVAMIRKERPQWQRGLMNGIGGKVEPGEQPRIAMSREFLEETGVDLNEESWDLVARLVGKDFIVYVYMCVGANLGEVQTLTDEQVVVLDLDSLWKESRMNRLVSNAMWLINLCLDPDRDRFIPISVNYE